MHPEPEHVETSTTSNQHVTDGTNAQMNEHLRRQREEALRGVPA